MKLKKEQDEVASSIRSMHKDNAKNVNDVKTQGVQADNLLSKLKSLIGVQEICIPLQGCREEPVIFNWNHKRTCKE